MVVTAATGTGLAAEADVTTTSQRHANRQGFNVSRHCVQHPGPPGPETLQPRGSITCQVRYPKHK